MVTITNHAPPTGFWVPESSDQQSSYQSEGADQKWFFIDQNKAYRGPITKQTLHCLFSSSAISKNTYVFSENLTMTRQWVKIRKLPKLLEELQQPLAPGEQAQSDAGPPAACSCASSGASLGSGSEPLPGRRPSIEDDAIDAIAPRAMQSPSIATQTFQVNMAPANMGGAKAASGAGASSSGMKLYQRFSPKRTPSDVQRKGGGKGGFFTSLFSKSSKPKQFGVPLSSLPTSENGVPEILEELLQLLYRRKGHLIEGIFRVSPAASALKAARQAAEVGQWERIADMEAAAQLIKVWFKELPESVFDANGCLEPIVDGTATDGAECEKLVQRLPEVNRKVVYWLLELICDICRHESDNRMTAQSMTIVFAPNLVIAPESLGPFEALELNSRVVKFAGELFNHWNTNGARRNPPMVGV